MAILFLGMAILFLSVADLKPFAPIKFFGFETYFRPHSLFDQFVGLSKQDAW